MSKFIRRGKSKIYWLPAVAAFTGLSDVIEPTAIEIAAGTDLSPYITAIDGFMFENQPVDTPILSSSLTPKIPGEDTVQNSKITFLDDDAGGFDSIRTLLAKGAAGFICRFPYGTATGKRVETWKVVSTGCNDEYTLGNEPARTAVTFAIDQPPAMNGAVPA